jgi:predicted TIM-barrel fold metal-dependent hydrolase
MTRRKIVDAHHHLWQLSDGYKYPWLQQLPRTPGMLGSLAPIERDYLPADYRADTAGYDLVHSVHIEAVPADAVAETRWLHGIAGNVPSAIVARVELNAPDAERVIAEHRHFAKVRGIRHIVNWHSNPAYSFTPADLLLDEAWQAGFALLKKYELSFDLQLYPCQMQEAAKLARRYPETLLILNHTGMPVDRDADGIALWRSGMKALAACDNVVVKISGLGMVDHRWTADSIRPFVLESIALFGAGRAMFSSNFPVDKLYSSFDELYGAFEAIVHAFTEAEKSALFHDNAIRFYRI